MIFTEIDGGQTKASQECNFKQIKLTYKKVYLPIYKIKTHTILCGFFILRNFLYVK
jgi:hypothetical protein